MRTGATETWYVFGWDWWPFDGAVTAALIALVGTLIALIANGKRLSKAESNQTKRFSLAEQAQNVRHGELLAETKAANAREHCLARFQEALTSVETGIPYRVEFGQALLEELADSEWLTAKDQRLAVRVLAAYNRPKTDQGAPGGAGHA